MAEQRPQFQSIPDEIVIGVMLYPPKTPVKVIARRFGLSEYTVASIRRRTTKRYVSLALKLGIIAAVPPRSRPPAQKDSAAYVPAGTRG